MPEMTRAIALNKLKDVFYECGTPVLRELERANLPCEEVLPDDYVSTALGYNFISNCQSIEAVSDLGWYAFKNWRVDDMNLDCLRGFGTTMTLRELLKLIEHALQMESNYLKCSLLIGPKTVNFVFADPELNCADDYSISEWSRVIQVVRCIQSVIDERWRPISIGFVTSFCPCDEAREYFSNTRILTKQIATSVSFSKIDLLHSTVKLKRKFASRIRQCPHFYKPSTDLHSFLRIVLLPYITSSRPDIKLAAEITGMSVRTLQRELNRCGVTYKRLLDQCIYEKASELLLHSNEKIIDVSLSVGFQDPSHFSRSFKRVSGFTPKEFRIANA